MKVRFFVPLAVACVACKRDPPARRHDDPPVLASSTLAPVASSTTAINATASVSPPAKVAAPVRYEVANDGVPVRWLFADAATIYWATASKVGALDRATGAARTLRIVTGGESIGFLTMTGGIPYWWVESYSSSVLEAGPAPHVFDDYADDDAPTPRSFDAVSATSPGHVCVVGSEASGSNAHITDAFCFDTSKASPTRVAVPEAAVLDQAGPFVIDEHRLFGLVEGGAGGAAFTLVEVDYDLGKPTPSPELHEIVAVPSRIRELTLDRETLFWFEGKTSLVAFDPKATGSAVTAVPVHGGASLRIGVGRVYWLEDDGALASAPRTLGARTPLAEKVDAFAIVDKRALVARGPAITWIDLP